MSIRLRLTLIYTAILACTLIVFSLAIYTAQAQSTLRTLKADLAGGVTRFSEVQSFLPPIDNFTDIPPGLDRLDRRRRPDLFSAAQPEW